jgi:hypothetical protein
MPYARSLLAPLAALLAFVSFAPAVGAKDAPPTNWDGLVQVKGKMDLAFVLPGADFRPYGKVMLDRTEVAFKKNWMRDMNDSVGTARRMSDADAMKIMEAARSGFADVFEEAFREAGYQVVTEPGPDVLRVSTGVLDLYINAPAAIEPVGVSRTYTANAGEATLVVEARDSQTNALMGRVIDRRETRNSMGMQRSSSVMNKQDFRELFKSWARITAKGLDSLKAISPVPTNIQPNQKLGK